MILSFNNTADCRQSISVNKEADLKHSKARVIQNEKNLVIAFAPCSELQEMSLIFSWGTYVRLWYLMKNGLTQYFIPLTSVPSFPCPVPQSNSLCHSSVFAQKRKCLCPLCTHGENKRDFFSLYVVLFGGFLKISRMAWRMVKILGCWLASVFLCGKFPNHSGLTLWRHACYFNWWF